MLCFKDSRRFSTTIEVAVVQFAQVHLVHNNKLAHGTVTNMSNELTATKMY